MKTKNTVFVSIVMSTEEREALNLYVRLLGMSRNKFLRELIRKEITDEQ